MPIKTNGILQESYICNCTTHLEIKAHYKLLYWLCFIKWNRRLIQIGFPFIIVLFLASHTRPPSFLQQSLSSLTTCPVLSHSTESCGGPITLHNYCAFPTVIGASSSGTKGAVRCTSDARHASERFVRSSSVVNTVDSSIIPWWLF